MTLEFRGHQGFDKFHSRGKGDVITFKLPHFIASDFLGEDVTKLNGKTWAVDSDLIINGATFKIKSISQFHSMFPDDREWKTYGFLIADTVRPESPVYDFMAPGGFRIVPREET